MCEIQPSITLHLYISWWLKKINYDVSVLENFSVWVIVIGVFLKEKKQWYCGYKLLAR